MLTQIGFAGLSLLYFLVPVLAVDKTVNPSLDQKLFEAPTNLDRINLLPDNADWIFDFTAQPYYTFSPGGVINANAATFPATKGLGMTLAVLNLGPCSMLPPHLHPRATNFVVAVAGSTHTYMINENGARTVETILTPGKMTIFPQAAVHMMYNTGCENSQLISALNSDDSGTTNLANNLFALSPEYLNAVFGYSGLDVNGTKASIPPVGTGAQWGSKECLAKCGLSYPGAANSTTS